MNDNFWFYVWLFDRGAREPRGPLPPGVKLFIAFCLLLALKIFLNWYF